MAGRGCRVRSSWFVIAILLGFPGLLSSLPGRLAAQEAPFISGGVQGDLDGDCDVDRLDLAVLLAARNTPATDPQDPRDLDGDGMITVLDARRLVLLCTKPRCAILASTCGPANESPRADAGPDQTVEVGEAVRLDGSASSDPDGDALSYEWAFADMPEESAAALDDPASPTPGFVPDVAGLYTVELTVHDGRDSSASDQVAITVRPRTVTVPDLAGMDLAQAEPTLLAAGLVPGEVSSAESETVQPGRVITQDPAAGTVVEAETPVNLVVSILTLVSLTVLPEEISLAGPGETAQISVTGLYNDGVERDITGGGQGTTYVPEGSAAVRVDSEGLVTAQDLGFGQVTVANSGKTRMVSAEVLTPPVEPPPQRLAAVEDLEAQSAGIVMARWNPRNGSLWALYCLGDRLSPDSEADPLAIAQGYLLGNPALFGLTDLEGFEVEGRYETAHNGVTHVTFLQVHDGIPFHANRLRVSVDRYGQVISVTGNYDPDPSFPSPTPGVTADEAVEVVAARLAPDAPFTAVPLDGPEGPDRATLFEAGGLDRSPIVRLRWVALADGIHLAWWVFFSHGEHHGIELVDAHSGALLRVESLIAAGIWGKAFLETPSEAGGNWSDVYFPDAWFNPAPEQGVLYPSKGRYARAWVLDPPYAPGKRWQDYWALEQEQDYNTDFENYWRTHDHENRDDWGEPDASGFYPDQLFAAANVFYWMNALHGRFLDLGFDYAAGSLEAGNWGRDSLFADNGVVVFVRGRMYAGYAHNNACSTFGYLARDAGHLNPFPTVQFGLYTRGGTHLNADPALDPDIIIHEYTHLVSKVLVGGRGQLIPMCEQGIQAQALSEAFSDFFACSFMDDPLYGEYLSSGPFGSRSYRLDEPDLLGYGSMGLFRLLEPNATVRSLSYHVAQVFSGALWELREKFVEEYGPEEGKRKVERLVIDAMKDLKARPSMLDARDAILAADSTTECGAHQRMIWEVFAAHGLGFSATSRLGSHDFQPHSAEDLPPNYSDPPEVETAEIQGGFRTGTPVEIRVEGKHFTESSRVYLLDVETQGRQDADFDHVDCRELVVPDLVFPHPGEYEICVENLVFTPEAEEGTWEGDCLTLDTDIPEISGITPVTDIPAGEAVSLEILGSNLTDVHTVTVVDPADEAVGAVFTVVDDGTLLIPSHVFLVPGTHRIVVTAPGGEAEGTVQVVDGSTQIAWALKALASAWWHSEVGGEGTSRWAPTPYLGLTFTTVRAESYGGSASITAELPIPVGEELSGNSVNVLHVEGGVVGAPFRADPWLLTFEGTAVLYFQEVITLLGAELPDGTVITEGTVPCHLELEGSVRTDGPLGDYGITAHYAYFINVAAVPDGVSLVDPFVFEAADAGLDPLGQLKVNYSSYYHGVIPPPDPAGTSDTFDLPVSGQVVIYSLSGPGFSASSYYEPLSMEISADIQLVSDDPGVELIYRK